MFATLTPDRILDAIDATGVRASGQVSALNSYENRVFQVGIEGEGPGSARPEPVIAKFYRPGRWSDAQILEEHDFLRELVEAEVPAVAPLVLGGRTLHHDGEFAYVIFPRRGGRTPELSDPLVLERLGRFLGRMHAVGARVPFAHRIAINPETFGAAPARFLAEGPWLPPGLDSVYHGLAGHALDAVRAAFERVGAQPVLRLHGDCHPGNLLWSEAGALPGPHFVDFDDAVNGPAIQDLWMLLSGSREDMEAQARSLLKGYRMFARIDPAQAGLIEPLRTLRLIHYAAWIARRWEDPAFPAAFPWFDEPRYWEARILELREQIAAMQEEPIRIRD
jgi:Ser/Thr protein kinase RdoA (MazF antagonist)